MNTMIRWALCALALTAPAHADKFYVGDQSQEEKLSEGEAASIEGVLLREENDRYVIRTVGGILEIPKSQVWKIETDDLTEDAVAKTEDDLQEQHRRDNELRRALLIESRDRVQEFRADVAAARAADADIREASTGGGEVAVPAVVPVGSTYDPVLGVALGSSIEFEIGQVIRNELGSQLRRAVQPQIKEIRRSLRKALR